MDSPRDERIFCRECGYNLTGCHSLVCPECGCPFNRAALLKGITRGEIECPACGCDLTDQGSGACPVCRRIYDREEMLQRRRWVSGESPKCRPPVVCPGPTNQFANAVWEDDLSDGPARLRPHDRPGARPALVIMLVVLLLLVVTAIIAAYLQTRAT